jgi:nucleoside-diphosphate-sugar epimerase
MKLLIIGGNGTIGKKVSAHFSKTHEIIVARCNSMYCRRGEMGAF